MCVIPVLLVVEEGFAYSVVGLTNILKGFFCMIKEYLKPIISKYLSE